MFDFLKGLTLEQQGIIILILYITLEKLFGLIRWLIDKLFKKEQEENSSNRLNWELTMAKIATIESALDDISDRTSEHGEESIGLHRKQMRIQEELHEAHLGQNARDADGRFKWWFPSDMAAGQQQLITLMAEVLGELKAIRRQGRLLSNDDDAH